MAVPTEVITTQAVQSEIALRNPSQAEVDHLMSAAGREVMNPTDSLIVNVALSALEEIAQTGGTSRSWEGIYYLTNSHP
ncbi:hypothetical protein HY469_01255 [Candidatus Roizmanbacteria bacterium]|nr:hypothetical protein [Candidatus Roizmanbacteria bacterium]